MALARKTARPAHILHVSTAEELEYLRDYRDIATVEVLLNHSPKWRRIATTGSEAWA